MDEDNHIVTTGIKLQRELLARLQKAADERFIGRNLLIRMLIEQGLDRLIPIENLMRKEEESAESNEADVDHGHGRFGRYLDGVSMSTDATPKSEPHAPGSTPGVRGGVDRPDPEGFGVCLDLSCPTDGPTTEVPAGDLDAADRRMDQYRKEHSGSPWDVVQ